MPGALPAVTFQVLHAGAAALLQVQMPPVPPPAPSASPPSDASVPAVVADAESAATTVTLDGHVVGYTAGVAIERGFNALTASVPGAPASWSRSAMDDAPPSTVLVAPTAPTHDIAVTTVRYGTDLVTRSRAVLAQWPPRGSATDSAVLTTVGTQVLLTRRVTVPRHAPACTVALQGEASLVAMTLAPGERLAIDPRRLVAWESTLEPIEIMPSASSPASWSMRSLMSQAGRRLQGAAARARDRSVAAVRLAWASPPSDVKADTPKAPIIPASSSSSSTAAPTPQSGAAAQPTTATTIASDGTVTVPSPASSATPSTMSASQPSATPPPSRPSSSATTTPAVVQPAAKAVTASAAPAAVSSAVGAVWARLATLGASLGPQVHAMLAWIARGTLRLSRWLARAAKDRLWGHGGYVVLEGAGTFWVSTRVPPSSLKSVRGAVDAVKSASPAPASSSSKTPLVH
ncbi:hypothetical protein CXG81DRAFT_25116 [Caulochytrium protostelioides]|uniref:Altered inheritance of mitochondria protein 24, mitochondrial n=1 Tax=Caulochytrium protostelioides TaxID=1555241 RepID=A0A4P9XA58_9FUNG|nr:hypothetical protein CXG81DRAFT_25116 [Caulochytrium protostelioides]|eukprot:RKP02253.1 hypothetical protein CXG81DRAFT_25116 [Caulochytrium protostelioides]